MRRGFCTIIVLHYLSSLRDDLLHNPLMCMTLNYIAHPIGRTTTLIQFFSRKRSLGVGVGVGGGERGELPPPPMKPCNYNMQCV